MKTRFHWLTIFLLFSLWILHSAPVHAGPASLPPFQEVSPTPMPPVPSPDEMIAAINSLRISYGLPPLNTHPILMQVAQDQAYVLSDSEGAAGHERPSGISLTEYLILLGYPLSGDLSLGGYRSENFVLGHGMTVQEAIQAWLGDDPHTNTMLSPNRSDIGAGIAVDDEGMIYYVIDTALQTTSGLPQSVALGMLTGVPMTQTASAQWAANLSLPQNIVPVYINTARPDGDVIHEVRYGQTLWSIAIIYGTTIEQIKRLNNLQLDVIVPGWTLLIQKSATQPPSPTTTFVSTPSSQTQAYLPTPTITMTPTASLSNKTAVFSQSLGQNKIVVVALIISFSVLVAGVVGFGKKKEE